MKSNKLNLLDAGLAFVLAFILAQFTSSIGVGITESIMQACGKSASQIEAFFDTAVGYLLQSIYMNIAFVLVFVWYIRRVNKNEVVLKPDQSTLKYVGKCVIIGIASLFLLSGILNYFQLLLDKLGATSSSLSYEINSPAKYIISLISLAVIPAVCEELIFRGVLVNALKSKGNIFAIIFSSLMFALFHFSLSQLIYPICFGLILSIVYLRTRNIFFPILLHFINNALSLSIQYFSGSSGGEFTHSSAMLIYAIVTLIAWIAIMIHLFKDFKLHCSHTSNSSNAEQSANDGAKAEQQVAERNQQSPNDSNEKVNNYVFYGCLTLMTIMYIVLVTI